MKINNAMPCTPHVYWVFGFSVIILYGHNFATMLYNAEVDIKAAQAMLGHKSIRVTMDIYTHLDKSQVSKAASKLEEYVISSQSVVSERV